MPLVVLHFTSMCSVKVSHMTDSVNPALESNDSLRLLTPISHVDQKQKEEEKEIIIH